RIPKMQVQNFALARKEIVFDVEPVHRFKMATQNSCRNQFGDGGRLACAVFNGVQRLSAHLQVLLILRIPLRNTRVEIPAVVIETGLPDESFDFGSRLLLDLRESDNYIGNLYSGVIDIVLHIDFPAGKAQES